MMMMMMAMMMMKKWWKLHQDIVRQRSMKKKKKKKKLLKHLPGYPESGVENEIREHCNIIATVPIAPGEVALQVGPRVS